jgi:hypothetical protein
MSNPAWRGDDITRDGSPDLTTRVQFGQPRWRELAYDDVHRGEGEVARVEQNGSSGPASGSNSLVALADHLYERFGRGLEHDHEGSFVAINPDGRYLIGATAGEVGRRAKAAFGPGNFVFKIGLRVVGRWR